MNFERYLESVQHEINLRGLGQFPQNSTAQQEMINGLGALFRVLAEPLVIRHRRSQLLLQVDQLIGPMLTFFLCIDDYEQSDLILIEKHVTSGDLVMNVGAGLGLIGMYSGCKSQNKVVLVEPDERLYKVISRNFEINNLSFDLETCCVVTDPEQKEVELYISEEIWYTNSQSAGQAPYISTTKVATQTLDSLLEKWKPSVVIIDIEGGEFGLFDRLHKDLPRIFIVEIHVPILGEEKAAKVFASLCQLGFKMIDFKCWTFVFERRN